MHFCWQLSETLLYANTVACHDISILRLSLDVDANAYYSLIYLVIKNTFIKYKKTLYLQADSGKRKQQWMNL